MNLENTVVPKQHLAILSAASGDQVSMTYDEKEHGLFTYFLLKGIKESTVRGERSLGMEELFTSLKPQVERVARKIYNQEQSPQLIGSGEILKTYLFWERIKD